MVLSLGGEFSPYFKPHWGFFLSTPDPNVGDLQLFQKKWQMPGGDGHAWNWLSRKELTSIFLVALSLDRSYFLGSFNLEMFLRMFLNFNNSKCITDHTQSECVERKKFYMHSDS